MSNSLHFAAAQPEHMHPGRTAAVQIDTERGRETIGYIGQVHPTVQIENDLNDVYVLEIELEPLYDAADFQIEYQTLPRYPAIQRDIAVVIGQEVEAGKLLDSVRETAGELLESVHVFDIYTGERLGADKKAQPYPLCTATRSER